MVRPHADGGTPSEGAWPGPCMHVHRASQPPPRWRVASTYAGVRRLSWFKVMALGGRRGGRAVARPVASTGKQRNHTCGSGGFILTPLLENNTGVKFMQTQAPSIKSVFYLYSTQFQNRIPGGAPFLGASQPQGSASIQEARRASARSSGAHRTGLCPLHSGAPSSLPRPRRPGHAARATPPRSYHPGHNARITAPGSQRPGHTTRVTPPGSHRPGHSAWITPPRPHLPDHTAQATAPRSHRPGHTAQATAPGSHHPGHSAWVTPPGSHCPDHTTQAWPVRVELPDWSWPWASGTQEKVHRGARGGTEGAEGTAAGAATEAQSQQRGHRGQHPMTPPPRPDTPSESPFLCPMSLLTNIP